MATGIASCGAATTPRRGARARWSARMMRWGPIGFSARSRRSASSASRIGGEVNSAKYDTIEIMVASCAAISACPPTPAPEIPA
eukprot:1290448-Pyramimonas_sp.AAC.1